MTHKIELVRSDTLERGERVIMVDGEPWGRTVVSHHGVWGTKHRFRQLGGELLLENPGDCFEVRSERRRRYLKDQDWRPTHDRVLEMAQQLVESGKLRHPDVVKAEQEETSRLRQASRERRDREEAAEFNRRAREALQINDTEPSPLVDRVVAAMRWAQNR